jgi:hypothetical protein
MSLSSYPKRVLGTGRGAVAEVIRYVRSLPELGPTLLLGGLLWAYGVWIIVPGILVMGYFVRVLRDVPPSPGAEDITPRPAVAPRFDNWIGLFVDGVKLYAIWIVYLFLAFSATLPYGDSGESTTIFLILLRTLLGNVGFLVRVWAAFGAEEFATAPVVGVSLDFPAVLLFAVAMYVAPAALLNFAARGRLRDGFEFDEIRAILASPTYAGRWVVFLSVWLVSSFVLYLPSAEVVGLFVPTGFPMVAEVLRESIELLRGLVSFALLLSGYVALGRVAVPPKKNVSLGTLTDVVLGTRLASLVQRRTQFGQTILVASLLGVFWSIPAVVVLTGYLVRFIRTVVTDDAPPQFDRLDELVLDGFRALGLWVIYMTLPLFLLVNWWTNTTVDVRLLTAFTGVPGAVVGAWYVGRDYFNSIASVSAVSTLLDPPFVSVLGVLCLAIYLYPAALVRIAYEGHFSAGLHLRSLVVHVLRRSYAMAWLRGMIQLGSGVAISLSWNWWRVGQGGFDTDTLVSVGGLNLVNVPTGLGIVSSLYLFVVSVVVVLLVFRAYSRFAQLQKAAQN